MIVVCEKCRCSNQFGAIFCRNCGAKLEIQDMEHPDHRRRNAVKRSFGKFLRLIIVLAAVGFAAALFVPAGFKKPAAVENRQITSLARQLVRLSYTGGGANNVYGTSSVLLLTPEETALAMRLVTLYSPDQIHDMLKVAPGERICINLYPKKKYQFKAAAEAPETKKTPKTKDSAAKKKDDERAEEFDFMGFDNLDGSVSIVGLKKLFGFLPLRIALTIAAKESEDDKTQGDETDSAGSDTNDTEEKSDNVSRNTNDDFREKKLVVINKEGKRKYVMVENTTVIKRKAPKLKGFDNLRIVSLKIGHVTVPKAAHKQTLELIKNQLCGEGIKVMIDRVDYVVLENQRLTIAFLN